MSSSAVGALPGRVGLLPADVDEHRAHLANRERDLQAGLACRLRLPRRPSVATQRLEQPFQPLDLGVVLLLRAAHPPSPSTGAGRSDSDSSFVSTGSGAPPILARRAAALRSCFRSRRSLTACSRFSFSKV